MRGGDFRLPAAIRGVFHAGKSIAAAGGVSAESNNDLAMSFKVTVLGSSSAKPTPDKHTSAHVLNVREQFYLIDCGEDVQRQLIRFGVNPLKINAIFISHLHGDHLYGLFPLISTLGLYGRRTPLRIFAPKPLDEILECHFRYFDNDLPYEVQFCEVDTRKEKCVFETSFMTVRTVPLRHRVPCCGYLFREKEPPLNIRKEAIEQYGLGIAQIAAAKRGEDILLDDGRPLPAAEITYRPFRPRAYAYCSDTQYSAKVARIVSGVDLLYHEATYAAAEKALAVARGHSTTLQAAKVASMAGVGRLLIGHFSSRYKDEHILLEEARSLFPATEIAAEGRTFEIPKQGE